MKKSLRFICLVIALILITTVLASCGNSDDTTVAKDTNIQNETGRDAVKDTVPADLQFKGETVTFFVRDENALNTLIDKLDEISFLTE